MDNDKLVKGMVPQPQLWRLALCIERDAIEVVLYSTVEDNSLIYRRIPFDKESPSRLRAIEEAIYSNPLLLSDFARVYCEVATDCYQVVPTVVAADADDCEKLMLTAFPEFAGEIISNSLGVQNATLLMGLDADLAAFLNRTFISPRISHPLSALTRYFVGTAPRGHGAKTCVHCRRDGVDIMIAEQGNLLLANSFRYNDVNDALYYVMACRRQLGLNDDTDEVYLMGDASAREALMPLLRQYVARVMPMIFPSQMYQAGKEAMLAPFDLIVLPLCE